MEADQLSLIGNEGMHLQLLPPFKFQLSIWNSSSLSRDYHRQRPSGGKVCVYS